MMELHSILALQKTPVEQGKSGRRSWMPQPQQTTMQLTLMQLALIPPALMKRLATARKILAEQMTTRVLQWTKAMPRLKRLHR